MDNKNSNNKKKKLSIKDFAIKSFVTSMVTASTNGRFSATCVLAEAITVGCTDVC